jgi:hypothetical protein
MGPGGNVVAGGSRGAVARDNAGNVAAVGGRGAIGRDAAGNVGAVGGRAAIAGNQYTGTYRAATSTLRAQGGQITRNFNQYNNFNGRWYAQHPGAWLAAGWAASAIWNGAGWGDCSSYCGVTEEPIMYDYGTNVTYEDDGQVYYDGAPVASQEQYYQQATSIADTGSQAPPADAANWQPLGVFAMVQQGQENAETLFQLAISPSGAIRGNYYNSVTETTLPVTGSMEKQTQRIAWKIGDKADIVFESALANLTQDESPMLVHYGKDRTEQYALIRLKQQDEGAPNPVAPAGE